MRRLILVTGVSMAPTYRPSDLVLVRRVGGRAPRRGDAVVLRHEGARYLKRVVGLPGDVVELEAGRVAVNGTAPDARPRPRGARTRRWHIPADACFVVGDNALASDDSRIWAAPFVALADVESVVVGRVALPRVRGRRRGAGARPAG